MGATYCVGDRVAVLRACRLPKVEEIIGVGVIERITEAPLSGPVYWVSCYGVGVSGRQLRHAVDDTHLRVHGAPRTLSERYAAEDEENRAEERWD